MPGNYFISQNGEKLRIYASLQKQKNTSVKQE